LHVNFKCCPVYFSKYLIHKFWISARGCKMTEANHFLFICGELFTVDCLLPLILFFCSKLFAVSCLFGTFSCDELFVVNFCLAVNCLRWIVPVVNYPVKNFYDDLPFFNFTRWLRWITSALNFLAVNCPAMNHPFYLSYFFCGKLFVVNFYAVIFSVVNWWQWIAYSESYKVYCLRWISFLLILGKAKSK
jgi:hypothetical protein